MAKKKFKKPRFCDHACDYADWPKDDAFDGSRSCRTFQALYCKKLKRTVQKNGPCQV